MTCHFDLPFKQKKPAKQRKPKADQSWKVRYQAAHEKWFAVKFPNAYKDGHYVEPKYPDVASTNGLQSAVVNYLTWCGHYANRINTQGQAYAEDVKTASGTIKKLSWRKGATRAGTPDVDSIIGGKPVKFEIKYGKDRIRDKQEEEGAKIKAAGGYYFIIKTIEGFYNQYDQIA